MSILLYWNNNRESRAETLCDTFSSEPLAAVWSVVSMSAWSRNSVIAPSDLAAVATNVVFSSCVAAYLLDRLELSIFCTSEGRDFSPAALGSLLTFAAFAHEINAKSEGERRHCGLTGPVRPQQNSRPNSGRDVDRDFAVQNNFPKAAIRYKL